MSRPPIVTGQTHSWIIWREILPNALSPVIVLASLMVATAILLESSLSFLGLGDPNLISWGYMVGAGRTVIRQAWWITRISRRRHPALRARPQPDRRRPQRRAQPAPGAGRPLKMPLRPPSRSRTCKIALPPGADRPYAVDGVSFDLDAGEIVCVVGESGSGKSMCAHALMGLLPDSVSTEGGEIAFEGHNLLALDEDGWRDIRGRRIAHGVSGADDGAQSVDADRRPDDGDVRGARPADAARAPRQGAERSRARSACPTPSASCAPIRINCPAASASAR